MKQLTSMLLVGAACVVFAPFAGAEEPTTLKALIVKYVEAIGGKETLDKIKSVQTEGKTDSSGMSGTFEFVYELPDKMRRVQKYPMGTGTGGFDGRTGWYSIERGQEKTGAEQTGFDLVLAEYEADFLGPLINAKKKGNKLKLLGKQEVDGAEAFKIEVKRKEGDVHHFFLDAGSFLPVMATGRFQCHDVDVKYQTKFSDYKDVDGLLIAHSQVSEGTLGKSEVKIERVRINVETTKEMFSKPATDG